MNKNDSTDCLTEWLETNPEMEQDGHGQRSSERSADRLGSDGLHGGGGMRPNAWVNRFGISEQED